MKKYELQVGDFDVTFPVRDGNDVVDKIETYKFREMVGNLLRAMGVFKTGEEIVEAITLAKQIRDCENDMITLDEKEADTLKKCLNVHISKNSFGGIIHETAILRIFNMKEV